MKRVYLFFSMFCVMSIILVGCNDSEEEPATASSAQVINLSYAFFSSEASYPGQMATYWAQEVEKRTNGKVNIDIYYSNTLLDANNMIDGVKKGVADIGLFTSSYESGSFPLGEIANLPNDYENATIASKVNKALVEKFPEARIDGLQVLKVFSTDPLYIHTNHKVETLAQLEGLQMRTPSNFTVLLDRLGAAAVGMSQAEQASALQTGIIDGSLTDRGGLRDAKLFELVDYVIDIPLGTSTFLAVMREEKWAALPEDVQQVMLDLNEEMPEYAGQYVDTRTREIIQEAQDEGVEFVSLANGDQQHWDVITEELITTSIQQAEANGLPAEAFYAHLEALTQQYKEE